MAQANPSFKSSILQELGTRKLGHKTEVSVWLLGSYKESAHHNIGLMLLLTFSHLYLHVCYL